MTETTPTAGQFARSRGSDADSNGLPDAARRRWQLPLRFDSPRSGSAFIDDATDLDEAGSEHGESTDGDNDSCHDGGEAGTAGVPGDALRSSATIGLPTNASSYSIGAARPDTCPMCYEN